MNTMFLKWMKSAFSNKAEYSESLALLKVLHNLYKEYTYSMKHLG